MKSRDLQGSPPAQGRQWVVIPGFSTFTTAAIFSPPSPAPLLRVGRVTQAHPEPEAGAEQRAALEPCKAPEPRCCPAWPCWPVGLAAPV